jgi:putative membrane protein
MFPRRSLDPDRAFGEADRAAIREAVAAAEAGTSGEVVPYVVDRCDDYPGAAWLASLLAALAAALASGLAHAAAGFWGGSGLVWITLPVVAAAALGYLAALALPRLRRRLIPDDVMQRRVETRAAAAFLDEEVFATRDRTGVLIFVSLFEHRALVLADEGINAVVEPSEWQEIVARMVSELRAGRPTPALVGAIEACGRLLHERRVERRPDDVDELDNELRTSRD